MALTSPRVLEGKQQDLDYTVLLFTIFGQCLKSAVKALTVNRDCRFVSYFMEQAFIFSKREATE